MERRVLIVDDHAPYRRLARRLLEAGGFTVVGEAADRDSALAAATALSPEVVLLDVCCFPIWTGSRLRGSSRRWTSRRSSC